jgi:hypothetical protein
VALDRQHDLPEFAGFFVLRHVCGLLEPDQLLSFGCLERLIVLLCDAARGDVIVSPLEQKHWDIQVWQHLKQVEIGQIRQQMILYEAHATQCSNDVQERIIA